MIEIRICDEYNRLICKHPRSYRDFPLYVTDSSHMPQGHLYYKEVNAHDVAYYRRWASVYGDSMVTLIDCILRSPRHEEQAYNSCAGVLHSCKDVPHNLIREVLWSSIFVTLMAKKPAFIVKIQTVPDKECGIHYSCEDGCGYT